MNPLISVVIPTYNRAHLVENAIQSVLNQTYQPVEIIVIDDGSTDTTPAIIQKYPMVRSYYQENQGVAKARNIGARLSKGDFIAFLDSDDLWVTRKLEIQMQLITKFSLPILGTRKQYLRPSRSPNLNPLNLNLNYHDITFSKLKKRTWLAPSTIIVAKSYFEKFAGFDPALKIAEDWDLWLRMAYEKAIPRMNAVLVFCSLTRNRLTSNRLKKYLFDLQVIKKWDPLHSNKVSFYLYKKWCWLFTLNRLFKLIRHCGKDITKTFWLHANHDLNLSRVAVKQ